MNRAWFALLKGRYRRYGREHEPQKNNKWQQSDYEIAVEGL
jgi:hypothetical protein